MSERRACPDPDCGSVMLEPRGSGMQQQSDHDYRCDGCGARLDESETIWVPEPNDGGINHNSPAKQLEKLDASEVFGDDLVSDKRAGIDPVWAGLAMFVLGFVSLLLATALLGLTGGAA